MMNKVTILGSGTSTGVPILGCNCQVCQSNDPRNKRFRTSVLLQTATQKTILIDASPDLRSQLLNQQTRNIDAVIITHDHADHTHGMDDLRPFGFIHQKSIPVFCDKITKTALTQKFPYIFDRERLYAGLPIMGGGIPQLHLIEVLQEAEIQQEQFKFFPLPHGHHESLGVLHGKLAYLIDCRDVPEDICAELKSKNLDLLIIDCLRYKPHDTHMNLDKSLETIAKIAPRTAILTHMGHEMDYLDLIHQLERRGIKNVFPAIDGQSFLYS